MGNANRDSKSNISTFADDTPIEDDLDVDWTYGVLREENNGYVVVQRTRTCAWYVVYSLYPRKTPHARKCYVNARLACQRASSLRCRTGGFEDGRHRGSRSCCIEPSSFLVLLGKPFDGSFLSPFTIPFIREAIQFLIKLKQCTIALSLNFDVPGLTT